MKHREPARIRAVQSGREDHAVSISLKSRDGGWVQSFGNLCLDERSHPLFVAEVCATFAVSVLDQLVGLPCFALYSFTENNAPIEGLEAESGLRFTIGGFRARHYPDKAKDALQEKRERLQREIAHHYRRAAEDEAALAKLSDGYHHWSDR